MDVLIGISIIFAAALAGIGMCNLFTAIERSIRLDALNHYRRNRAHVRWMKRSREYRASLRRA